MPGTYTRYTGPTVRRSGPPIVRQDNRPQPPEASGSAAIRVRRPCLFARHPRGQVGGASASHALRRSPHVYSGTRFVTDNRYRGSVTRRYSRQSPLRAASAAARARAPAAAAGPFRRAETCGAGGGERNLPRRSTNDGVSRSIMPPTTANFGHGLACSGKRAVCAEHCTGLCNALCTFGLSNRRSRNATEVGRRWLASPPSP